MTASFLYFDILKTLEVHELILRESGGRSGIINQGILESIIDHIQNDIYYPELEDKLTHLVFAVAKSHGFVDGNKRTSLGLAGYFLELNGFDYCVSKFFIEMENIVVWVVENKIGKDLLKKIISSILFEDDYSEELKLSLFQAIG